MDKKNNIDKLIEVYELYSKITNWRSFMRILKTNKWYLRLGLWSLPFVCGYLFIKMLYVQNSTISNLWFGSLYVTLVLFWILVDRAEKSIFKDYYKRFSKRIKFSLYNNNYIRYLIFKNELDNGKYSQEYLSSALSALKIEERPNQITVLSQPWVYFIITAIIASAVSFANYINPSSLVYVSIICFFILMFGVSLFKIPITRANKLAELKQFIRRYLSDVH